MLPSGHPPGAGVDDMANLAGKVVGSGLAEADSEDGLVGAARDYKAYLYGTFKRAPATVNAALADLSDLAIRRGLGKLDGHAVARLDLPPTHGPHPPDDIRWQRAAQAAAPRDRPGPEQHQEELAAPERCRAYARLAEEEVARLRTVQGEMALFLASGLLGATLPHYFNRNHWWAFGAAGGVTSLFGASLKLRSLARNWQRRTAFYYQQAASYDQHPSCSSARRNSSYRRYRGARWAAVRLARLVAGLPRPAPPRPPGPGPAPTPAPRPGLPCEWAVWGGESVQLLGGTAAAAAWAARSWFSRNRVTASASAPSCATNANGWRCSGRPKKRAAVIATARAKAVMNAPARFTASALEWPEDRVAAARTAARILVRAPADTWPGEVVVLAARSGLDPQLLRSALVEAVDTSTPADVPAGATADPRPTRRPRPREPRSHADPAGAQLSAVHSDPIREPPDCRRGRSRAWAGGETKPRAGAMTYRASAGAPVPAPHLVVGNSP
jgi:hypothetical protein